MVGQEIVRTLDHGKLLKDLVGSLKKQLWKLMEAITVRPSLQEELRRTLSKEDKVLKDVLNSLEMVA